MRCPFDATGTIGSRPCEVALNKILAEKGDRRVIHKITKMLMECRRTLKALLVISDETTRSYLAALYRRDLETRIEKITGTPVRGKRLGKEDVLTSHTACCISAYFSNFLSPEIEHEKVPDL